MSLDTDFPFGANDTSEATAVVTEADRLTWRDVEALRIEARADVATVADAHWTRALSYVARLKVPCVRTWAARWLAFCTVGGARPPRHIGEAGKACRKVELALARLGVIDPHGFEEREAPKPSRASKTRAMRRRQSRGGDCNGLREFKREDAWPMDRLIRPIARLERRGATWIAYADGRGAPIVRPVPGNTHPASAATWPAPDEAARELSAWGFDVAVFALRGAVTPLCSVRATLDSTNETADRFNADPFIEPGTTDPDAPYTVEATTLDRIEAETGQRWGVNP